MTNIRAGIIGALAFALVPAPARAADDGMTVLETVGVFVLLPMSIWGVIWLLWSIPKWRRDAAAPSTGESWNPTPSSN